MPLLRSFDSLGSFRLVVLLLPASVPLSAISAWCLPVQFCAAVSAWTWWLVVLCSWLAPLPLSAWYLSVLRLGCSLPLFPLVWSVSASYLLLPWSGCSLPLFRLSVRFYKEVHCLYRHLHMVLNIQPIYTPNAEDWGSVKQLSPTASVIGVAT